MNDLRRGRKCAEIRLKKKSNIFLLYITFATQFLKTALNFKQYAILIYIRVSFRRTPG
jgi:hypothetical protein